MNPFEIYGSKELWDRISDLAKKNQVKIINHKANTISRGWFRKNSNISIANGIG